MPTHPHLICNCQTSLWKVDKKHVLVWKEQSGVQAAIRNCPPRQTIFTATPNDQTGYMVSAKGATGHGLLSLLMPIELRELDGTGHGLDAFVSRCLSTTAEVIRSVRVVRNRMRSSWCLITSTGAERNIATSLAVAPTCGAGYRERGSLRAFGCFVITAMPHSALGAIAPIRRNQRRLVDSLSGADSPSPPQTHPLFLRPRGLCVWRHRLGGATRVTHGGLGVAQKGDGASSLP
jgi:hypothetical protein